MLDIKVLQKTLNDRFSSLLEKTHLAYGELTVEVLPKYLRDISLVLRDDHHFDFKLLVDVCGVDYLYHGISEWATESTTETGFGRGVDRKAEVQITTKKHRFASVYHLLSLTHNQRIRLRVFLDEADLKLPSVTDIWPSANWFEREAFDLFGIVYEGHPDLRRILTDYGFVGHPFRKDFPISGHVEARYDAKEGRVIYQPVSIPPRVLEPKVIRQDNRYKKEE